MSWAKGMEFDELFNNLPSNGWLTREEARLLYESCLMTTGPILEVGCYEGRSTVLLASLDRPVYTVDKWDEYHCPHPEVTKGRFLKNLSDRGIDNVQLFSEDIEDWNVKSVGFAYLDGDHSFDGTLAQVDAALLAGANVIAVHDVNDSGGGVQVKEAVTLRLGKWTKRVDRLAVWVL